MKSKTYLRVRKLNRDEKGLTLLEYAAGAAFVLVIAAGAFTIFDASIDGFFTSLGTNMGQLNVAPTAPTP